MNQWRDLALRGRPLAIPGLTDLHAHLGRPGMAVPDCSAAGLVRVMDRIGVERAVCSPISCLTTCLRPGNRLLLTAMRDFPGRLLGYAALRPWSIEAVRDEARWALDAGFAGFKLFNAGFSYRHPALEPAYRLAHERRRPLLFHTWGEQDVLDDVAAVARDFPGASVIVAHAGCSNEAGYIALARSAPNVFLDTVLSRVPRGLVERLVAAVGAERVVWGSDAVFISMTQQIGRVLGTALDDEAMRLILAGNAARLLGAMR